MIVVLKHSHFSLNPFLQTFIPSANGNQRFQVFVVRFQASEFGVATFFDILILIERFEFIVFGETAECINQMRT